MTNPDSPIQINRSWLPSEDTTFFFDSTFFQRHTMSDLPSVAAIETATWPRRRLICRFPSLSLAVKRVGPIRSVDPIIPASAAEGQVLWALPRLLPQIQVPEVYGWRRLDNGALHIFMELIDGETLRDMWPTLLEEEKAQLCEEAGNMIRSLRRLTRLTKETFIGAIGGQPLGDRVFAHSVLSAFTDADSFYTYLTGVGPHLREKLHQAFPELVIPYDDPFVFTHADIALCNIMVTRRQTNVPLRIAAIIDWEQSGWLPLKWEAYKARAVEDGRDQSSEKLQYLAIIAGLIDDDLYEAFGEFVMSHGGF